MTGLPNPGQKEVIGGIRGGAGMICVSEGGLLTSGWARRGGINWGAAHLAGGPIIGRGGFFDHPSAG